MWGSILIPFVYCEKEEAEELCEVEIFDLVWLDLFYIKLVWNHWITLFCEGVKRIQLILLLLCYGRSHRSTTVQFCGPEWGWWFSSLLLPNFILTESPFWYHLSSKHYRNLCTYLKNLGSEKTFLRNTEILNLIFRKLSTSDVVSPLQLENFEGVLPSCISPSQSEVHRSTGKFLI